MISQDENKLTLHSDHSGTTDLSPCNCTIETWTWKVIVCEACLTISESELEVELHVLLKKWRNSLCEFYTLNSVSKVYDFACQLDVPPGNLRALKFLLTSRKPICDKDDLWRRGFCLPRVSLWGLIEDYLRPADSKTLKKLLEELLWRHRSSGDGLFHVSRSVVFLHQFYWHAVMRRYSATRAKDILCLASKVQKLLNKSVLRLATRYSVEQVIEFHGVISRCSLNENKLPELHDLLLAIEDRSKNDNLFAKSLKIDPLTQFTSEVLRSKYGEDGYSQIKQAADKLDMTLGILGNLPREEEARIGWESFFECKTFVTKYPWYSDSSKPLEKDKKEANKTYADALEIQCIINEVAYDLSKIFSREEVRKLQEEVCQLEVKAEDINDFLRRVAGLRDAWNKEPSFRRRVISNARVLFEGKFSPDYSYFVGCDKISRYSEDLWPRWSRLDLGYCTCFSNIILLLGCLLLAIFKKTSWLIMVPPSAIQLIFIGVALSALFGHTPQLYRDYCAIPKRCFILYSKRKRPEMPSQSVKYSDFLNFNEV